MSQSLWFFTGLVTGVVVMIAAGLWADNRSQEFYMRTERERPTWSRG